MVNELHIQATDYCSKPGALRRESLRQASAFENYLGSGLIKGVGPVTARRIVKHFGEKTLDVFENNIESLSQVEGIALLKLEMISKAWTEHKEIRNVMMFLQSHNISISHQIKW